MGAATELVRDEKASCFSSGHLSGYSNGKTERVVKRGVKDGIAGIKFRCHQFSPYRLWFVALVLLASFGIVTFQLSIMHTMPKSATMALSQPNMVSGAGSFNSTAEKPAVAFIMPFYITSDEQMRRVLVNFERWNVYPPCKKGESLVGKALFLLQYEVLTVESASNVAKRKENLEKLRSVFENSKPARQCFGDNLGVMEVPMLPEDNRHPFSTCVTFYTTIGATRGIASHFFQMEGDVLPIRAGWASKIYDVASTNTDCQFFWQAGSWSRTRWAYGLNDERQDYHLNGNALYCLEDDGFHNYLKDVREFYPTLASDRVPSPYSHGCMTGKGEESGFDHAIYRYRVHPSNVGKTLRIEHKFAEMKFIANFGEEPYDENEIRTDKDIFLVHSKFPHLPEQEQQRRKAYWEILRIDPTNPPLEGNDKNMEEELCRVRRDKKLILDYPLVRSKSICPPEKWITVGEVGRLTCGQFCAEHFGVNYNYTADPKIKKGDQLFFFAFKAYTDAADGMVEVGKQCGCFRKLCSEPFKHLAYNIYSADSVGWPEACGMHP
mmetsp:Transcript_5471/g.7615  ORF Transcript_5471/g.7615 Transcript_5471/m.7615 type:complete len:550 (+) Transcript_5471:21-1670(+)